MIIRRKSGRNPNCQLCDLWQSAEHPCLWGMGKPGPKVMVLLEAPGRTADRGGAFVTGPAGKTFIEMLDKAEINLNDCYISHAVKCKCPDEESPSAAELKACKEYLTKELNQVQPEIIVTLGAGALKSLARGKITELHGQLLEVGDFKVYPLFHPAVALRDPSKLPALRKDINRLGKILRGEPVGEAEIHWQVIRNMSQWNSFIDEFTASPEVSVDTETTGLDREKEGFEVNALQIGLAGGRNFVIPFCVRESPWTKEFQRMFLETLIELSVDKICVFQNGKFDNLNLRKKYGMQFKNSFDTMLAHHILDENSPHGLDAMASEYLDAPQWDIDLETKLGLGDLEKFYKYGCYDAYYTLQLYYIFRAMLLKQPGLRRLFYKLVMPVARVFEDIEEEGLFVDMKRLKEVEAQLIKESDDLLAKLKKIANINWNSPKQIGTVLFEQLGVPVLERTPGGDPSTAESTLLRIEHPVAKLLMEYRGVEKNLSTYILGWQGLKTEYDKKTGERKIVDTGDSFIHNGRLFMSTKISGTVTGRYSSRLHTIPREGLIRSIVNAPPGWTFVVCDFSQVELRMAAFLSNDQRMKMVFQTGGDIHSMTASELTGKSPESLSKEERKMAKAVNFGFLFSMQYKKFQAYAFENYGLTLTEEQAKAYRRRFFELYSALPDWHERQRRCVRLYGEVTSISGRIRHLPGINSSENGVRGEAERQAINSVVQGFASADLKAMAMIEIRETLDWPVVKIKGEVHDSILMEIKDEYLDSSISKIKSIMENPKLFKDFRINFTVPLVADAEAGRWGEGNKI